MGIKPRAVLMVWLPLSCAPLVLLQGFLRARPLLSPGPCDRTHSYQPPGTPMVGEDT